MLGKTRRTVDRGGGGNVGIMRSPLRATTLPDRESCCGKTAIHHACQPEFRRAKNCRFAPRRLGQKSEAKRVRRSLSVSRQSLGGPLGLPCRSSVGCLDRVVVNLLLMHGAAVPSDHFATSTANTRNRRQPFRPGRLLRRFRWLTGNLGAPGKSFRAKRLYDVDARGACRREHRSDYRRA